MEFHRAFRRWLAVVITGGVLAVVVGVIAYQAYSADPAPVKADDKKAAGNEWPMFGGTLARNLVNLKETNIATEADVTPGGEKNIKWSAILGSKAYGGPIMADGKIFTGTKTGDPGDAEIPRDKENLS